MITANQMRAARASRYRPEKLAEMAGVSLPAIQRMEAGEGDVRDIVDSLMKVVSALDRAGIELIGEHAGSDGSGRGARLRHPPQKPNWMPDVLVALSGIITSISLVPNFGQDAISI